MSDNLFRKYILEFEKEKGNDGLEKMKIERKIPAGSNTGKEWFRFNSNKIFLPKDKTESKTYLHEYLGIPIKRA